MSQIELLLDRLLSQYKLGDPVRSLIEQAEPLIGSDTTARNLIVRVLEEYAAVGASATYDALLAQDYIRRPVTITEFMTSKKYAGGYGLGLHPKWHTWLANAFDPIKSNYEFILTGAIGCLTGNTKISLLNGTEVPIKDLPTDKDFYVYSCTPEGEIVPGHAHSARVTRKNAELVEVTLDNNESIRCTPDHPFMMRDGTYKEAKDLKSGDSLMPLYKRLSENRDGWLANHIKWVHPISNHKVLSVRHLDQREDVYDLTVEKYHNFALSSGVFVHNCGKTTVAVISMLYKIYLLSCLRDICNYFSMMKDSAFCFALFNVYVYKADENYTLMQNYVSNIPYFKEIFPARATHSKIALPALEFPTRISVVTGASQIHALGEQVIGFFLDEANFMKGDLDISEKGQAQKLYEAAYRRMTNRFQRRFDIPGLVVLCSSRQATDSWLEKRLSKVKEGGGTVVASFARWDVKPENFYCGKKFRVLIGDRFTSTRIVGEGEQIPIDAHVIEFPIEHRREVEEDPDGSIRDIAGISTVSENPLIHDRQGLYDLIDKGRLHPFTHPTFTISHLEPSSIEKYFNMESMFGVRMSLLVPRVDPEIPRHIHVDIGLTGDSAGIACCHIVPNSLPESPFIYVDFMLKIVPPGKVGHQIDLEAIRRFIVYLRNSGMRIGRVTYDGFQSAESVQMLQKVGFNTATLSVDRTDEPYLTLRQTMTEKRVSYYSYEPFLQEMIALKHFPMKRKVDHPDGASKDIADAVCGCVYSATLKGDLPSDMEIRSHAETVDDVMSGRMLMPVINTRKIGG